MTKKEFDSLSVIPNYFLFYGHEYFLREYEKIILEKFKDSNIFFLNFDEYNFELAKNHLIENSLFNNRNVLIVRHNKSIKGIEKLIKLAKNSYFFFFYYQNKPIKVFKNNMVRFFEPNLKDLIIKITQLEKKFNITISNEAKIYIARSVDAVLIEREIEKLSLYKENLDINDVKKLLFEYKDENLEDIFIEILLKKDFKSINNFLETNDLRRFSNALIKYIKDLYKYKLSLSINNNLSLKDYLGYQLPKDIESNRLELINYFTEKDFINLLEFLLNKEIEMRKLYKSQESLFYEMISFLKKFKEK